MKILLVDDEELALEVLDQAVLDAAPDADITVADNVKDALDNAKKEEYDVAFLDIEMPEMDGITLASKLKEIKPTTNVVFVTAFSEYAFQASKTYFSGYFVKPVTSDMVKEALGNLRFPVEEAYGEFSVRCFGQFEVFYNDEPLVFKRKATKELLAYLIHLRGAAANTERLCETLWPDNEPGVKERSYMRHLIADLAKTLEKCGKGDAFIKERNAFAIKPSEINCDLFKFLDGDVAAVNSYCGEYMDQYEWAYLPTSWKY